MKFNKHFLGRYSLFAVLSLFWLALGFVLRLGLAIFSYDQILINSWELLKVFVVGCFFDLIVIPQALLPILLYLTLCPRRFFAGKFNKVFILFLSWLSTVLLLLGAVTEFYFWEEYQSRFNFIAVDYLVYTTEVWGVIRDSYPLGPILTGIGIFASLITLYFSHKCLSWETSLSRSHRLLILVLVLLFPVVIFFTVNGNMKNISSNVNNNELAGNGLYELISAFRNNELDYARFYKINPENEVEQTLRKLLNTPNNRYQSMQPWDFTREIKGTDVTKFPHIVFITVESLSSDFMGFFGNTQGLTPNLDRLTNESLFFTSVYATGTRTVRGLEALTLSIPPTPGQSIVRRADNGDLFSLGSVLNEKGYKSWFVYGGYGYFDNMNDFYEKNGYTVLDRTRIPQEKIVMETVWGVADEVIFNEALEVMDNAHAKGELTFQMIMTTSNHKPYTYPDGRVDIPSPGGRNGAVKYTDWAIGNFLTEAQKRPWFKDTVFIITGDHQASSAGKTELPVIKYHVPLIIYGPDWIIPERIDRLMSQIDIAPTLLGLLNFSYTSRFLGYDLLNLPVGQERIFISTYQSLGYVKGDKLVILNPKRQTALYQINYQTGEYQSLPEDHELLNEAVSWYQGASKLYKSGRYRSISSQQGER